MAATSELLQYTTVIYCTKYRALTGLNSFFVMCVARNKYSNTVNWRTLFETYIRRTPTVGCFPCCFQSFFAKKLPICEGHLSTSPEIWSWFPTMIFESQLTEFQFLLNFKLLAPSWELVNCRIFCWFLFMLMQSTDIGCKGNLFLNKMVGSCIIIVPNFNINQALNRWWRKW